MKKIASFVNFATWAYLRMIKIRRSPVISARRPDNLSCLLKVAHNHSLSHPFQFIFHEHTPPFDAA
jgi:hypothetical protein